MLVSIVIPCYNSEHSIKKTVELTVEEFKKLPGYECEFVLVNDYSKDGTFASIKELCGKYPFVKGITQKVTTSLEWMTICRHIRHRFQN